MNVMAGAGQSNHCGGWPAHTLAAVLSDAPVASRKSETRVLTCEDEGGMIGCGLWR